MAELSRQATGAALQQRQRRLRSSSSRLLRSWPRFNGTPPHWGQKMARTTEEVVNPAHEAPRGQETPLPGTRASLDMPCLAGRAAEMVDTSALSFLTARALGAKRRRGRCRPGRSSCHPFPQAPRSSARGRGGRGGGRRSFLELPLLALGSLDIFLQAPCLSVLARCLRLA